MAQFARTRAAKPCHPGSVPSLDKAAVGAIVKGIIDGGMALFYNRAVSEHSLLSALARCAALLQECDKKVLGKKIAATEEKA